MSDNPHRRWTGLGPACSSTILAWWQRKNRGQRKTNCWETSTWACGDGNPVEWGWWWGGSPGQWWGTWPGTRHRTGSGALEGWAGPGGGTDEWHFGCFPSWSDPNDFKKYN